MATKQPIAALRRQLLKRCPAALIKNTPQVGWWVDGYFGYQISNGYFKTERKAVDSALTQYKLPTTSRRAGCING